MIEISLSNVKKSFGFKYVLNGINLEIKTGERVSIIGENGCGKTTIFNIIAGEEDINEGSVAIRRNANIGYLRQQPENNFNGKIVKDILYDSFKDIFEYEKRLKKYEEKMSKEPNDMSIISKYLKVQEEFIKIGGYEVNTMIDKVSYGLNIKHLLESEFSNLSGGEQKRVSLASIIVKKPDILLLDEPTNHLDIKTLEWLEDFLNKYEGTIVMVSHDRYFLDQVTNKTILIENGKSYIFYGNYTKYLNDNELRMEKEFKDFKLQQNLINALNKKIKQLEEFGRKAYPGGEEFFRRAENIRKRIQRLDKIDNPYERKDLPIKLNVDYRTGQDVLVIEDYDLFIQERLLIQDINIKITYKDRVCIIGDNGCGKTTLINKIISNDCDNIKVGSNVKIGYIPQQINFNTDKNILEFARTFYVGDESHLRSALYKFYFCGESVFKKVSKLSGGEKVRLKLFQLMQEKCNFIILDEPTNHIDLFTKETLEEALNDFEGTILFVSHDRYFINKLANKILYINELKIKEYNGDYDFFVSHRNN